MDNDNPQQQERTQPSQQQQQPQPRVSNPLYSDEQQPVGSTSPFSHHSLGTGTVSSLGDVELEGDNASESGSSSVGIASTSSTQTGKRSLRRRAQEFDRLLQSQSNALTDYDSPERQETEDDGLQSELQNLARSEVLLRRELEIFDKGQFLQSGDSRDEEMMMDDSSTLPDYDEDHPFVAAAADGRSPRTTTGAMATTPWTPPQVDTSSDNSNNSHRVSVGSDLELPTLDELRRQRLGQVSPTTRRDEPDASRLLGASSSVPHDEEEEDHSPQVGLQYPPSLSTPGRSPFEQSSPQPRLPLDAGTTAVIASPARVSLEDNKLPTMMMDADQTNLSANSGRASPFATPPRLQIDSILEGLSNVDSSDDSLFMDLAKLSSTTPRVSNIKGKAGQPLKEPSPSSLASSLDQDSPRFASMVHNQGPSATMSGHFWSQPPSSPAVTPMAALSSGYGKSPAVTHGMPPSAAEDGAFFHTPATSSPKQGNDNQVRNEDYRGLLDDYVGSSWKNQHSHLYPAHTTPILSASDEDDQEVGTPPGEHLGEYVGRQPRRQGKDSFWWFPGQRRGRQAPLLRVSSSVDSSGDPMQTRRRNRRGVGLLLVLFVCGICAIVIPTSVVVSRDRRNNNKAAALEDDTRGNVAPASPSMSPSFHTLTPTQRPTVSIQPSVSIAPSPVPSTTPEPTKPQPTTSPTIQPTDLPSPFPTTLPTTLPTYSPSSYPSTSKPTGLPTTIPTTLPTQTSEFAPTSIESSYPTTGLLADLTLGDFLAQISFDGGLALSNVASPQYAAYQWLENDPSLDFYDDERIIQRYAMATVYYSLGGPGWLRNNGWVSAQSECAWFSRVDRGVCRRGGRRLQRDSEMFTVRRLVLYYNDLTGTIPPEIGLLTDLEELHLMGGPSGSISGSLPSELGYLSSLKEVQLANNKITGTIPTSLQAWNELKLLDMFSNMINGPLPDVVVGGLNELVELNLSFNALTGRLPDSWPSSLEFLDVENNQMAGPVSPSIGILQDLRLLRLSYNSFTSLPTDIISLQNLQELSVTSNRLQGPILPELGFLKRLKSLRLANNELTGRIPVELGLLSRILSDLDLSDNNLVGAIPAELGQVNNKLARLSLAGNHLSGEIPVSLASLDRLAELRLEDNEFTGIIGDDLCTVWDRALAAVYVDCAEVTCACCNFCCSETEGCQCRYADDPELAWRCH